MRTTTQCPEASGWNTTGEHWRIIRRNDGTRYCAACNQEVEPIEGWDSTLVARRQAAARKGHNTRRNFTGGSWTFNEELPE